MKLSILILRDKNREQIAEANQQVYRNESHAEKRLFVINIIFAIA